MAKTSAISSRLRSRARAPSRTVDGRIRQLVERHRADRGDFVEADPDIGEHDDDERRQIEQHDEPGVAKPVDRLVAAHRKAKRSAERHGDGEGGEHAGQSRRRG